MEPEELLEILRQAGKLKTACRHCDTAPGRKESVADHSWRLALMAMLLSHEEEFRDVDMDRVIRMCLIHDLGESFTGDIPAFEKSDADREKEHQLLKDWISSFPDGPRQEWQALYAEMEEKKTTEAKLYKALDRLEAVISHDESDISTWLPLEYDLQFTYGREDVKFSRTLTRLKEAVDAWTAKKEGRENPC